MRLTGGRIPLPTLVAGTLGLLLAWPLSVRALSPLPSDALQAYDRGLVAADQQAWDLAITNFAAAQKLARWDARLLYSLGLAHAKAGHDFLGAVWLRASLAVAPTAPNAPAVQQEIARLLTATRAMERRIFAAALAAARQIPWADLRYEQLHTLALLEAGMGEIDAALAVEQEAAALARTILKDQVPGWSTIEMQDPVSMESAVWQRYIDHLVEIRELAKAQEALAHVRADIQRSSALVSLALGFAWSGQREPAQKLLAEAERVTARIGNPERRLERLLDLANAYAEAWLDDRAKQMQESARVLAQQARLTLSDKKRDPTVDESAYAPYDEATTWIDYAEQFSGVAVLLDVNGSLQQASHPRPTPDGRGEVADIARRLQDIAGTLGKSLQLYQATEAVPWAKNLVQAENLTALAANDAIYTRIGSQALGERIGIDTLRAWSQHKDAAWRASPQGKAIHAVIAAVDDSGLYAQMTRNDEGWAVGLFLKGRDAPLYVSKRRSLDLRSVMPQAQGAIGDELVHWILTDPASPLSGPIQAAKEAIQGESLP